MLVGNAKNKEQQNIFLKLICFHLHSNLALWFLNLRIYWLNSDLYLKIFWILINLLFFINNSLTPLYNLYSYSFCFILCYIQLIHKLITYHIITVYTCLSSFCSFYHNNIKIILRNSFNCILMAFVFNSQISPLQRLLQVKEEIFDCYFAVSGGDAQVGIEHC